MRKPAKSFYVYLHYNFRRVIACRASVNTLLHLLQETSDVFGTAFGPGPWVSFIIQSRGHHIK